MRSASAMFMSRTVVCQETDLKHTMLYGFLYGMVSASVRRSRLAKAAPV